MAVAYYHNLEKIKLIGNSDNSFAEIIFFDHHDFSKEFFQKYIDGIEKNDKIITEDQQTSLPFFLKYISSKISKCKNESYHIIIISDFIDDYYTDFENYSSDLNKSINLIKEKGQDVEISCVILPTTTKKVEKIKFRNKILKKLKEKFHIVGYNEKYTSKSNQNKPTEYFGYFDRLIQSKNKSDKPLVLYNNYKITNNSNYSFGYINNSNNYKLKFRT